MPSGLMQISPEQGQFMGLLVRLIGIRRILEIGVFTGYSSLAMALALPEDGTIVACDISEEYTRTARKYWKEAKVDTRIQLKIGPAIDTLEPFDLVFIDADKGNYSNYYEAGLSLLRKGGLILVDNVLWSGKVADPENQEEDTVAIREFNQKLHQDDRIDLSLLPIGDGLTFARKR
jgi:predicted O-methyltransferase YrrM